MRTTNTSYTEELALGNKADDLIKEMRIQGLNNFAYMTASFLFCWMLWQFFICWYAYQFGIFSQWTGNSIEFFLIKSTWTKYRVTVTFLLTPVIFLIVGLFAFRLTYIKRFRSLRPLFTWMFLMLLTFSVGQMFVGFLFKKFVSYVAAYFAIPNYYYPILAIPFGVIMALIGRRFETMLIRLASRQRMINTENKRTFIRITAIYPLLGFLFVILILFLPKPNWIMLAMALTASVPVVVAYFYGGTRYNFRSVKPYTPRVSMNAFVILGALVLLIRIINFFTFKLFNSFD